MLSIVSQLLHYGREWLTSFASLSSPSSSSPSGSVEPSASSSSPNHSESRADSRKRDSLPSWDLWTEKYDVGPPLVLLGVITLAPTVDALDMPFEGMVSVKLAIGGCGGKCCCCCRGGPKLGETEVPWGMKLGERVADVAGQERCEAGMDYDSGERLVTAPSGWIMGKSCEPPVWGDPCSDCRCCCVFITVCSSAWSSMTSTRC